MPTPTAERNRMIVDIPLEVQMAIKIRALKNNVTTGEIVSEAVKKMFPKDLHEAKAALAELNGKREKQPA